MTAEFEVYDNIRCVCVWCNRPAAPDVSVYRMCLLCMQVRKCTLRWRRSSSVCYAFDELRRHVAREQSLSQWIIIALYA